MESLNSAIKPKVSVVLSIYNVDKYLDECMSSLLFQTLKDIEIIMVDDESPDNCPKICDNYQNNDSRVKVIHKKNEGLGMARNTGLSAATGEFVCFFDPDDFYDKDMLLNMYTKAVENNLDAIYCCFRRVNLDGHFIKEEIEVNSYTEIIGKEDNIRHGLSMIGPIEKGGKTFSMSACKVLFKRQFLIDNNLYFESERKFVSEDMIFDIDFYSVSSRVGILPNAYYNYRINPMSLSQKKIPDHYNKLKIQYQEIIRRLKAGGIVDPSLLNVAHRYFLSRSNALIYTSIARDYPKTEVNAIFNEVATDTVFWRDFLRQFPLENFKLIECILLKATLSRQLWVWKLFVSFSKFKNRKLFK